MLGQPVTLVVLEENHYYPFGMKHKGYNTSQYGFVPVTNGNSYYVNLEQLPPDTVSLYKYKFQGQERQDELGLNWDSFKYRNYDYAIGRFMNIDPLAEDYNYQSPYNFAENRVIDHFELEGLEGISTNQISRFNGWLKNKFDTTVAKIQTAVSNKISSVNKFVSNALSSGGISFTADGGKNGGMKTPQGDRYVPEVNVSVLVEGLTDVYGPITTIPGVAPDGSNPFVREGQPDKSTSNSPINDSKSEMVTVEYDKYTSTGTEGWNKSQVHKQTKDTTVAKSETQIIKDMSKRSKEKAEKESEVKNEKLNEVIESFKQ